MCASPFDTSPAGVRILFRKMWNWGHRWTGERDAHTLAVELLAEPHDFFSTRDALDMLGGSKTPRAIQALIAALAVDYDEMARRHWGKPTAGANNADLRARIAGHLRANTGQDFGTDAAKWREWCARTFPGAN